MTKQTALDKALATLGALTHDELLTVRDTINDLLQIHQEQAAAEGGQNQESSGGGGRGYIEHKMIRGFGPYAYLRRWKGKTLTSTYLGKVRS